MKKKYYSFGEIIDFVKNAYISEGESSFYTNNGWCVYSDSNIVESTTKCYIDNLPEVNDNDEEVYPEYVQANGLELIYRCDLLQDVISSAIEHKPEITDEEFLKAIRYYDDNDDFSDLRDDFD